LLYYSADTYTEIENGLVVDYYCLNGQRVYTEKGPVPLQNVPTCLYGGSSYQTVSAMTWMHSGDLCFKQTYSGFFVCDP